MKKLFFLLMAFSLPLILPSCSSEEPNPEPFRTRAVGDSLPWYGNYDEAYDSFWELMDSDEIQGDYLSTTQWLPKKIKDQFITALDEGGASTNDPEYPWESTSFVMKEVLEWGGEEGRTPTKIRYTLWALQIDNRNGREYYRYFIPESSLSYYTVEIDPYAK